MIEDRPSPPEAEGDSYQKVGLHRRGSRPKGRESLTKRRRSGFFLDFAFSPF